MSRSSRPACFSGEASFEKAFIAKHAKKFRRGREENQRGLAAAFERLLSQGIVKTTRKRALPLII
jgi:hypothetical protein